MVTLSIQQLPARKEASPLESIKRAQRSWSEVRVHERLKLLKRLRRRIAAHADLFTATVDLPGRTRADTLAAEVLPLLDACKFLELEAEHILRPLRAESEGRPLWLRGVEAEILREALGTVLILGPSNYPIFLPGAQALQALAAGNGVIWKPGTGGRTAALLFEQCLREAGIDADLLLVTKEDESAAKLFMKEGVDKVFLTGSAQTGVRVLASLASCGTPSVMELSGCDAVFLLGDADLHQAVKAIEFGLRFNGSRTCMAPRRVFVDFRHASTLEQMLLDVLPRMEPAQLTPHAEETLDAVVRDTVASGGRVLLDGRSGERSGPVVLCDVAPEMWAAQVDIFAPLLSIMPYRYEAEAVEAARKCPFALTAVVFGEERAARRLAGEIEAGTVFINDMLAPSVDPRVPFGGRKRSGFGVSRGREGLLEMTAIKTVLTRKGRRRRHYDSTTETHADLFSGYIAAAHAKHFGDRIDGWRKMMRALFRLKK